MADPISSLRVYDGTRGPAAGTDPTSVKDLSQNFLHMLTVQLRIKEEKELLLLTESPQARYQHFLRSFPALEARVPDHQIAAYLGPRGTFEQIDKGAEMRLGIFFKERRHIEAQYKRWTQPAARGKGTETRLDRLIPRLTALHRNLIFNSQAAELLLAQELAEIGRFAARR